MQKYDKRAKELNEAVWRSECTSEVNYDDDLVRRSIVHARMDIVLLVSHLSSVNGQLCAIKWLLVAILGLILIFISN